MNAIETINDLINRYKFSEEDLLDIRLRIGDWLMSNNNNPDDPYIWQQVRFLKNIINLRGLTDEKMVQKNRVNTI
ncbi:hypothetical protein DS831_04595 [Bombilactobacillus bombi]|uniref:DUF6877 domain-containing protein n=1 Tax=Bombilactobacillus bombi TaxID=1303590 RepID=A0A3R6VAI5_9LACO|nr:DUF6877 family protein [Bombilactobacillus bombi]RHW51304.1 hypothetical protein DS831_04595 [Bombilactobacillus bombi]